MKPDRKLLATLAVAALIVGACSGSSATPSPSSEPSTAPASGAPSTAASSSPATLTLSIPEKTTLKIGLSTTGEISQYAEYLAMQLNTYQKYGFSNVEVSSFEGDGKVVQALIAGALDFGVIGVSSAISSQTTDTPLKVISMNGVTLTDSLVCQSSIKTADDIKGKQVAVSTFGGTSHGSVLILLKQLGLTASDVTITQVGGQSARIAALKAGSIACAPIDVSLNDQMKAAGLNVVTDNKTSGLQWGRSGLASTADYLQANPNTALDVVAAVLDAQNSIFIDPATAATDFAAYSQQDAATSTSYVNDFLTWGDRGMGWTDDAFNFPKETLATVNPAMANVDVTTAYDKSYLQKLWDGAFYTQINDPDQPFK